MFFRVLTSLAVLAACLPILSRADAAWLLPDTTPLADMLARIASARVVAIHHRGFSFASSASISAAVMGGFSIGMKSSSLGVLPRPQCGAKVAATTRAVCRHSPPKGFTNRWNANHVRYSAMSMLCPSWRSVIPRCPAKRSGNASSGRVTSFFRCPQSPCHQARCVSERS